MKLHLMIPNPLPPHRALACIRELVNETNQRHLALIADLQQEWVGDTAILSCRVKGYQLNAEFTAGTKIEARLNLPWIARPLRGKIRREIARRVEDLLAAALEGAKS